MKKVVLVVSLLVTLSWLLSCQPRERSKDDLSGIIKKLDSLEIRISSLENSMKPRLSVLMNRVQVHHSRMWEPGITGNWDLLKYELSKTRETLGDIRSAHGETIHGTSTIGLELNKLESALDSLESAVKTKNKDEFVQSYQQLTTKCNSCHQLAGLDFYEIIKPVKPAYSSEME